MLGAMDGHRSGQWVLGGQLCVPLQIADLTAVCLRDPRVASLEAIPWVRTSCAVGPPPAGRSEVFAPGKPLTLYCNPSSAACPDRAKPRWAALGAAVASRRGVLGTPPSLRAGSGCLRAPLGCLKSVFGGRS